MSRELMSLIKPVLDIHQDPQPYFIIFSKQQCIQSHLPQDIFYQEGVLTFQNQQPIEIYIVYDVDPQNFSLTINVEPYAQVDIIEIKMIASLATLNKTMNIYAGAQVHTFSENLSDKGKSIEKTYLHEYAQCQCGYSELSDDSFEGTYHFYLDGEEARAQVRTAILSKEKEDKHYEILIQHNCPMTHGQMDNYGVVKDMGKLIIDGIGTITKGQHGSAAHQTNKIMVFDETCKAGANPFLYIDDYDVQASHAAAVGKMDEEHLYYLQSRGLSKKEAMQLITYGYLMPVVEVIDNEMIKAHFEQSLSKVGA